MNYGKEMDRRVFLVTVGKAFPVTVGGLYLIGCGDDDMSSNPNDQVILAQSSVSAGHTHTAELPLADLDSMQSMGYLSSNSGGHTHTATLTAADFETLRTSNVVTITSTVAAGHTHNFTFRR